MDKITHVLENVVRCKYFEAGVHIKNPIKNSYQDGLGRTTQTLDHVVVVHILIWDKRKSQINEYSDIIDAFANPPPSDDLFGVMISFRLPKSHSSPPDPGLEASKAAECREYSPLWVKTYQKM